MTAPTTAPTSAKVLRPQPARPLARTRLYKRLNRLRACPTVWVVGPPGAGKTTLVSSYLKSRRLKNIWYQIDAGDDDPATFFYYLSLAARVAITGSAKPLPVFTPEHHAGIWIFARRYFEALYASLKRPMVIVLDNYQEVSAGSPFHEIVVEAATMLPPHVTLLVVSRAQPPAVFARLRAYDMLAVLDGAELKLTIDEAHAIAQLRKKKSFDTSVVDRLHRRSEGWTAGLVLLLDQPHCDVSARPIPVDATYQVLFDYFATEIFQKLTVITQRILCQAAMLPKASVDWVRELTGKVESGAILADLYRRNYFVVKHGSHEVYQFHPLFHDFLLHRAHEVFAPSELDALRAKAAILLDAAGDIEAAAELLRASSDWNALQTHILKHASTFAAQARFPTLESWLRVLPADISERAPWVEYWLGKCRMQFDPVTAASYFEQAYRGFQDADDATGLYASWSGVATCQYLLMRDYASLTPWLSALEVLRGRHPVWPSVEIELEVVTGAIVAYFGHRPDHPNLRLWLAHALRLINTSTNDVARVHLATQVVMPLYWLGENRQAASIVKSIEHAGKNIKNAPITEAWWHIISLTECWQRLAPREALRKFDQALVALKTSGVRVMDYYLYALAVFPALAVGDLSTAQEFLRAMGATLPADSSMNVGFYWSLHALIDLSTGKLSAAIDRGRRALALAQAGAMPFGEANCHLYLAIALYEAGERENAQAHLRAMHDIGMGMGSRQIEYWCRTLEAHFAFGDDNIDAARKSLASALALSREMDGAPMFWWSPAQVASLYAKALAHDIETAHVCDAIRRLELVPADSAAVPECWPFAVKIHTFGRFSVLIKDKPLLFTTKAQKKPLELLKGLIALGGRGVREDKLARALWPAAEDAQQALATTVHRLRKLIGEDAIERSEGCLTLNPRYCWVDVWALERHLASLDRACQERRLAEIASQIDYLFARYGNGFLVAEGDVQWAAVTRDRLKSKLVRQLETVANILTASDRYDIAINCYRKALEIDPLAESLYSGLMEIYAATGRRAEALSTYERCRRTLNEQLGVNPSPRTEALACQFKATDFSQFVPDL